MLARLIKASAFPQERANQLFHTEHNGECHIYPSGPRCGTQDPGGVAGSRSSGRRYVLWAALRDPQSFVLFDQSTAGRAAITNVNLNILKRFFVGQTSLSHLRLTPQKYLVSECGACVPGLGGL